MALAFDEQVCDWAKEKQLVCGRKMGSSRLWINAVPSSRQVAQWDKRGEWQNETALLFCRRQRLVQEVSPLPHGHPLERLYD